MRLHRLTALLLAAAVAASVTAAGASARSAGDGLVAAHAAKKCKKGKRRCKKKRPPSPYVEGQPCDPGLWKAYAKYDFHCLQQPQPDGTSPYLLVKSRA
jgi:hypothetical protein